MLYSVWQPKEGRYRYYQTPGQDLNAPVPTHLRQKTAAGVAPDDAAWPLPATAKLVGAGLEPKGMVARTGGGRALGDVEEKSPRGWFIILGLAAAAYGMSKVL